MAHRAAAMLALLLAAGCGRPAGEIFPRIDPPLVWPAPPDAPRIRYVGQLATDADLRPARTGWQAFAQALGGPASLRSVSTPCGIAVTRQRVYVTDTALHGVHMFDLDMRRYAFIQDTGDQQLVTPAGVAIHGTDLFVTDAARHIVLVFDLDGRFKRSFGEDRLKRPVGIAVFEVPPAQSQPSTPDAAMRNAPSNRETAPPGRSGVAELALCVVDTGSHECVVFDAGGGETRRFGGKGSAAGQFNFPTAIATHPALGIFVADTLNFRVQRFTLNGEFVSEFGRRGDGAGDFALPKGIAVDSQGHVYVVDAQFENVQVFDPQGNLLLALGTEGRGRGQFWLPNQAAIDQRNRLWVADAYNRRVQVFELLTEPGR